MLETLVVTTVLCLYFLPVGAVITRNHHRKNTVLKIFFGSLGASILASIMGAVDNEDGLFVVASVIWIGGWVVALWISLTNPMQKKEKAGGVASKAVEELSEIVEKEQKKG